MAEEKKQRKIEASKKYYRNFHPFRRCDICGREIGGYGKYCRQPPCPSTKLGENPTIIKQHFIGKSISKSEACKIVTCEPLNKYRDILFEKFNPPFTVNDFNKVRQVAMKTLCGEAINRGLIGAIFYLMTKNKYSQPLIAINIKCSASTIGNYIRKINPEAKTLAATYQIIPIKEKRGRPRVPEEKKIEKRREYRKKYFVENPESYLEHLKYMREVYYLQHVTQEKARSKRYYSQIKNERERQRQIMREHRIKLLKTTPMLKKLDQMTLPELRAEAKFLLLKGNISTDTKQVLIEKIRLVFPERK